MNYLKHYKLLVDRARYRCIDGYTETHHILSKCMGGGNEKTNLVKLTPEEHYVAHQLLVKIYPNSTGLIHAAIFLTASKKVDGYINNKAYGWLKKLNSSVVSKRLIGNKHLLGFNHSDSTKKRISDSLVGRKKPQSMVDSLRIRVSGLGNPMYGRRRTEEQKICQSLKVLGILNGNSDKRVHMFLHADKSLFTGLVYDFKSTFGLEQSSISHLISGRTKTAFGWQYLGVKESFRNEMVKANQASLILLNQNKQFIEDKS